VSEDESFLERWARRKREAADNAGLTGAKGAPGDPRRAGDVADGGQHESKHLDPASAGEAKLPSDFEAAKLPSLDSITAETDIRAFLLPGVPAELSRAALRRAWSADPAIREFIGLAEYDWDFNSGAAVAGFGPLEMSEELRRRVVDMVGRNLPAPDRLASSATEHETTADAGENPGDFNVAPAPTLASKRLDEDSSRNSEDPDAPMTQYSASQHSPEDSAASSEVVPRRHGRALPT